MVREFYGRTSLIWSFESLAQRASLRSNAFSAGVWPPKGGPDNVHEAVSVIAMPEGQ